VADPEEVLATSYTPNGNNQYGSIERPNPARQPIRGRAHPQADVTVKTYSSGSTTPDQNLPVTRESGGEFSAEATVDNDDTGTHSDQAYREVRVRATRNMDPPNGRVITQERKVGGLHFPPENETLQYDEDGNLTADARWTYTWDAENRLIQQQTTTSAAAQGVPNLRLTFTYDSQSRRVRKEVRRYDALSQMWLLTSDHRFLYDGWNLVAEFEMKPATTAPTLVRSYTWGTDLSGTLQGAGGVGGLLFVSQRNTENGTRTNVPSFDGNGNITAWLDLDADRFLATYEYDGFGRVVLADESGTPQPENLPAFGFSTKYTDRETGMLYYGYRYYVPEVGRWPSRDPIADPSFRAVHGFGSGMVLREESNLYRMAHNDPVNRIDRLGLLSTAKFIWWYETKFGATYDVVAEGELMQLRGMSGIQDAEAEIFKDAARSVKINAISFCSGKKGKHTYHYSNRGNRKRADLTFAGNFWLGDTTLFWGLAGDIEVDCPCTFKYVGPLKMSLRDRGEDPLDIGIETGVPYSITADWETNPNIGGRLDDFR
jgi:RHS repeat-associated protein